VSEPELAELRIAADPAPGVNLFGPLRSGSGVGEASRMLARALEHAAIPFVAVPYGDSPSDRREPSEWPSARVAPYDTNLLCLQPDRLDAFALDVDPRLLAERTTIGLLFWESTVFPDHYRPSLRLLDRIWATSEHVRGILSATTAAPVSVVPIPISERSFEPVPRGALGFPGDGFLFLSLFDLFSTGRKNPHAVVEAYRRAFEPGSGTRLVLKTINGRERKPRQLAALESAVADRDDIVVVDGYVPAAERDAMIAACDCFVSLHRAEGLGLPLIEAMRLGKPAIATGFSGNLDFMDDDSSFLVPYRLVPVPEREWGYSPRARWAEPSIDAAASLMRRVFGDPEEARAIGEIGRSRVLARFSLDRAAAAISGELEVARLRPSSREHARRRRAIVDASLALARDATRVRYPGRRPVARLRRLLVRAMWPQLVLQQRRDAAMLDGLSEVERSLARLEARVAAVVPEVEDDGRTRLREAASRTPTAGSGSRRSSGPGPGARTEAP
jgi:glycosyltransferase involved in cell wall biosynthesis